MRKWFFILFFSLTFLSNAQSVGNLIVKLRNTQNDSIKHKLVNEHFFATGRNNDSVKIKNIDRILSFAIQNKDSLIIAQVQIEKSKLLIDLEKDSEATKILNNIVLPNKKSKLISKYKSLVFLLKGNICYYNHQYKKALEEYYKAYNIATTNNLTLELIKINNNISLILQKQDQQNKALHHFKHNLELGTLINSKNIINKSRFNLARTYLNIHKLDSSRYYSKQLIESLKNASDFRSSAYYIYAKASLQTKPIDSVILYLNKSLYDNRKNFLSYFLLAEIYKSKKDIDKTITYNSLSLKYAKEKKNYEYIHKNLFELGNLYHIKKEYKKAYKYFRQSKILNDSIRSVKGYNEITKAITKFDSQNKDTTIEKQKSLLTATENEVKKQRVILFGILFITLAVAIFFVIKYKKQQLAHQITLANKTNAERNIIANELHETVGEQLTYIISSIDNLLFNKNLENKELVSEIKRIKEFAAESITLFRDTLWVLSKAIITTDELIIRNDLFFERIKNSSKHIKFNKKVVFNYKTNINTRTVLIGFRMMQEIIKNAVKHSNTKTIDIYFKRTKEFSIIKIKDYGKGFDPNLQTKQFGLKDVKRQVEDLGGTMEIIIDNGTEIILKIPVHAQG